MLVAVSSVFASCSREEWEEARLEGVWRVSSVFDDGYHGACPYEAGDEFEFLDNGMLFIDGFDLAEQAEWYIRYEYDIPFLYLCYPEDGIEFLRAEVLTLTEDRLRLDVDDADYGRYRINLVRIGY